MRLRLLLPLSLTLLTTACGDIVDEWIDSRDNSAAVRCSCNWQVLGFASEGSCNETSEVTDEQRNCLERVFREQSSEDVSDPILNCRIDAEAAFQDCLTTETCTDLAHVECQNAYLTDLRGCPQFSDEVDAALVKCE